MRGTRRKFAAPATRTLRRSELGVQAVPADRLLDASCDRSGPIELGCFLIRCVAGAGRRFLGSSSDVLGALKSSPNWSLGDLLASRNWNHVTLREGMSNRRRRARSPGDRNSRAEQSGTVPFAKVHAQGSGFRQGCRPSRRRSCLDPAGPLLVPVFLVLHRQLGPSFRQGESSSIRGKSSADGSVSLILRTPIQRSFRNDELPHTSYGLGMGARGCSYGQLSSYVMTRDQERASRWRAGCASEYCRSTRRRLAPWEGPEAHEFPDDLERSWANAAS